MLASRMRRTGACAIYSVDIAISYVRWETNLNVATWITFWLGDVRLYTTPWDTILWNETNHAWWENPGDFSDLRFYVSKNETLKFIVFSGRASMLNSLFYNAMLLRKKPIRGYKCLKRKKIDNIENEAPCFATIY